MGLPNRHTQPKHYPLLANASHVTINLAARRKRLATPRKYARSSHGIFEGRGVRAACHRRARARLRPLQRTCSSDAESACRRLGAPRGYPGSVTTRCRPPAEAGKWHPGGRRRAARSSAWLWKAISRARETYWSAVLWQRRPSHAPAPRSRLRAHSGCPDNGTIGRNDDLEPVPPARTAPRSPSRPGACPNGHEAAQKREAARSTTGNDDLATEEGGRKAICRVREACWSAVSASEVRR